MPIHYNARGEIWLPVPENIINIDADNDSHYRHKKDFHDVVAKFPVQFTFDEPAEYTTENHKAENRRMEWRDSSFEQRTGKAGGLKKHDDIGYGLCPFILPPAFFPKEMDHPAYEDTPLTVF